MSKKMNEIMGGNKKGKPRREIEVLTIYCYRAPEFPKIEFFLVCLKYYLVHARK